jgi:hypothetical protein
MGHPRPRGGSLATPCPGGGSVATPPPLWPKVAVLPSFCFLFWYFVFILSLCIFLEMLMCHVVIGG